MLRRRAQRQATDAVFEFGLPVSPDVDLRLSGAIARGNELVEAGRNLRTQREYERWKEDVAAWRTAIAKTLEAGFATASARDALLEVWAFNTPLCTICPEWLKVEREALNAALELVERIRESAASYTAEGRYSSGLAVIGPGLRPRPAGFSGVPGPDARARGDACGEARTRFVVGDMRFVCRQPASSPRAGTPFGWAASPSAGRRPTGTDVVH